MSTEERIPLGLQLWSVRDDCSKDFPGTLRRVAEMGYDGVEFAGYYGCSAGELKSMLADLGLRCAGTHTGIESLLGDAFEQTVAFNKTMGNKTLVVPGLGKPYCESVDALKRTAELFCTIAERARDNGVRVGYHNHSWEFEPIDGLIPHQIIFDATPSDFVMQLDIGWAFNARVDARDVLKRYPGRALSVHVKEHSSIDETAVVGKGQVPWADVLAVCQTIGETEWFVVEHERYAAPPLECVRDCIDYLKSIGR